MSKFIEEKDSLVLDGWLCCTILCCGVVGSLSFNFMIWGGLWYEILV